MPRAHSPWLPRLPMTTLPRSTSVHSLYSILCLFFFFNDTATTEIYTLSLHDPLPIYATFPRSRPSRLAVRLGRWRRPPASRQPSSRRRVGELSLSRRLLQACRWCTEHSGRRARGKHKVEPARAPSVGGARPAGARLTRRRRRGPAPETQRSRSRPPPCPGRRAVGCPVAPRPPGPPPRTCASPGPPIGDDARGRRDREDDLALDLSERDQEQARLVLPRGEPLDERPRLRLRRRRQVRHAVEVHEHDAAAALHHPPRGHRRVDAAREQRREIGRAHV